MASATISDVDFAELFESLGPANMSKQLDIPERQIFKRRRNVEKKLKRRLAPPNAGPSPVPRSYPAEVFMNIKDGQVIIGSDAHYWPGEASTAHRAFVHFIEKFEPDVVIMNGDAFDGSSISRHPPIGWAGAPTVQDELEACQLRLSEIIEASPESRKIWTLGNHDARFETRIATVAPELARVYGTSLKDHFPEWEPCWAVFINDDVVVSHRFKGGIHATRNNALNAGRSMVTGHLHSAKVTPVTDYNGTRWGVDAGCLADPSHQAFIDYTEANPKDWRSGFCILTFKEGKLLMPELVLTWDSEHVQFRGELHEV